MDRQMKHRENIKRMLLREQAKRIPTLNINPFLIRSAGFGVSASGFIPSETSNYMAGFDIPSKPTLTKKQQALQDVQTAGGAINGVVSAYQGYQAIRDKYTKLRNFIDRYNRGDFDERLNRLGIRRRPLDLNDDTLDQDLNEMESVLGRQSRIGSLIEDDNTSIGNLSDADLEGALANFDTPRPSEGLPEGERISPEDLVQRISDQTGIRRIPPRQPIQSTEDVPESFIRGAPRPQPGTLEALEESNQARAVLGDRAPGVRGVARFQRGLELDRDTGLAREMAERNIRVGFGQTRDEAIRQARSFVRDSIERRMGLDTSELEERLGLRDPTDIGSRIGRGVDALRARVNTIGERVNSAINTVRDQVGRPFDDAPSVDFTQMGGADLTLQAGDSSVGYGMAGLDTGIGAEAGSAANISAIVGTTEATGTAAAESIASGSAIAGGVTGATTATEAAVGASVGTEVAEGLGEAALALLFL